MCCLKGVGWRQGQSYSSFTLWFLVNETPLCLSFPALEVVIELVIIPRAVVIISRVITQRVRGHRAGRAAGWALWSCRDEAPGSTSAASCSPLTGTASGRADPTDGSAQLSPLLIEVGPVVPLLHPAPFPTHVSGWQPSNLSSSGVS